jgi:hypothetical protein
MWTPMGGFFLLHTCIKSWMFVECFWWFLLIPGSVHFELLWFGYFENRKYGFIGYFLCKKKSVHFVFTERFTSFCHEVDVFFWCLLPTCVGCCSFRVLHNFNSRRPTIFFLLKLQLSSFLALTLWLHVVNFSTKYHETTIKWTSYCLTFFISK